MEGTFYTLLFISFSLNSVRSLFKVLVGISSRGVSQNYSSSDVIQTVGN